MNVRRIEKKDFKEVEKGYNAAFRFTIDHSDEEYDDELDDLLESGDYKYIKAGDGWQDFTVEGVTDELSRKDALEELEKLA